jgi:outer membrane protein OmpA-like peptidoglycan-associated protein
MKKAAAAFLFFCCMAGPLLAQTDSPKKKFSKAEAFFSDSNFTAALPIYLELLNAAPDNSNLNYKVGTCYLNSLLEKHRSLEFLQKAVQHVSVNYKEGSFKEVNAPVTAYLFLGDGYHFTYQFDSALVFYKKFKDLISDYDSETQDLLDRKLSICRNAIDLVKSPVPFAIRNLGPSINSPEEDYSAVVNADQTMLIFTSRRAGSTGGKLDVDGKYFEDIYISFKKDTSWGDATNIGSHINTDGHEASIGTSIDGQQLFIYRDDKGDGNIYYTQLSGDDWIPPIKLDANINSKYWEPSCSLSPDGNILYFVSDTLGGFGGSDIYYSRKLPNGKWGKARNMGAMVNTKYNEDAPFIQADGVTLYFSSQGHKTMGGYDIFHCTLTADSGWTTAENIGYPLNTTGDDLFYVPASDKKHAYYSSSKEGGFGDKDIYEITFADQEEADLTVYSGVVNNINGTVPDGVQITVTDNATGELIGTYTPNSSTGKYVFILKPGKNYNIAYEAEGYLFHSDNMNVSDSGSYEVIRKPILMESIKSGEHVVLKNIFFNKASSTPSPESNIELDRLKKQLMKYPGLVVEICDYTDGPEGDENPQQLSEKRAQSIAEYLVENGIDGSRITATGYGNSRPLVKSPDTGAGNTNRKWSANRRLEIRVLNM